MYRCGGGSDPVGEDRQTGDLRTPCPDGVGIVIQGVRVRARNTRGRHLRGSTKDTRIWVERTDAQVGPPVILVTIAGAFYTRNKTTTLPSSR